MTKDAGLRRSHSTNGSSERRKEKHVSRACNVCRRRKSKCDGQQPFCNTCLASGQECSWTMEEDGRRPVTKSQLDAYKAEVQTLRSKLDIYEHALREQGLDPDALAALASPFQSTPPQSAASPSAISGSLTISIPGAPTHAPMPGHGRSVSSPNAMLGLLAPLSRPHSPFSQRPNSPFSPYSPGSPYPHSPASATSSLPSPLPGGGTNHFLTVPGASSYGHRRAGSDAGSVLSTSTEEDSAFSDSESEALSPYASPGKRLLLGGDDGDELVAAAGSSPLALTTSPPLSPAPGSRSRNSSFSAAGPAAQFTDALRGWRFPPDGTPTSTPSDSQLHTLEGGAPFGAASPGAAPCPCEWARHLTSNVRVVLTQSAHDAALRLFLLHGAPWELRLVPRLFLRDMRAALSTPDGGPSARTAHYSPALHNAVLAEAGAVVSPDNVLSRPDVRAALAREARERVEEEVRTLGVDSVLSAVQTLSLLARYHCGLRGGSKLAFMYHGMAVRIAQIAGLDLDCSDLVRQGRLSPEDKWARDLCYWSLHCQDVDMSLHVGQELSLPRRMDLLTLEPDAGDAEPWAFPPPENAGPDVSGVTVPAHILRTFAASVGLFCIAARVVEITGQRRRPDSAAVMRVHADLAEWHGALPEALQVQNRGNGTALPHVLMLNIAYQWFIIVLHRSFYTVESVPGEQAGSAKTHSQFINEAATRILRHVGQFDRLYGLRRAPLTAVQAVFAATSISLLRAHLEKSGAFKRKRDALDAARTGIAYLRALGKAWGCASEYADKLAARITDAAAPELRQDTSDSGATTRMAIDTPSVHRHGLHTHSHSVPAIVLQVRSASPGPGVLAQHHRHTEPAAAGGGLSFAPFESGSPVGGASPVGSPLPQYDLLYPPSSPALSHASEVPELFNSFGGPAQAGLGLGLGLGADFAQMQHMQMQMQVPMQEEYGVAAAGAQLECMTFAPSPGVPVTGWTDDGAGMLHVQPQQHQQDQQQPSTTFNWAWQQQ